MITFSKSFRDKKGNWDSETIDGTQAKAALAKHESFAAFGAAAEIAALRSALVSRGVVCAEPAPCANGRTRLAINPVGIDASAWIATLD